MPLGEAFAPIHAIEKLPSSQTGRKLQSRSLPCLQHWERAGTWAKGKGPVDPREFGFSHPEVPGPRVLGGVVGARCFGDREEGWTPRQEPERDLARRRVVRDGNFLQRAASGGVPAGEAAVTEWGVADQGDVMILAPRQHCVLDRALLQMVERLIADETAFAGELPSFFQVGHIEVAHAPG